jgi:hypothetical protein
MRIQHTSPELESAIVIPNGAQFEKYALIIKNVYEEFTRHFEDITKLRSTFDIFVKPFSVCAKDAPQELQLELLQLQSNTWQRDRFYNTKRLQEFYSFFPQKDFPRLYQHAANVMSMFGSTYVCERFFFLCFKTYQDEPSIKFNRCES